MRIGLRGGVCLLVCVRLCLCKLHQRGWHNKYLLFVGIFVFVCLCLWLGICIYLPARSTGVRLTDSYPTSRDTLCFRHSGPSNNRITGANGLAVCDAGSNGLSGCNRPGNGDGCQWLRACHCQDERNVRTAVTAEGIGNTSR